MRVDLLLACVLVTLIVGCPGVQISDSGKVVDYTIPPSSPWLDPSVKISSAVRLITKSGYDLRRALFAPVDSEDERMAILLLRDYTQRKDGVPDPQMLLLLNLDTEILTKVNNIPGELFGLHCNVEGEGWIASSFIARDGETWDICTLAISRIASDATVETWDTQERLWPLGTLRNQGIAALPIDRLAVAGGLVTTSLSWLDTMQRLDPEAKTSKPQIGPWIMVGRAGLAAGLALEFDPALPTQARLTYHAAPGADTHKQRQWHFGYYTGDGNSEWIPPMAEVDDSTLAAIVYQGDGTGKGKGNGAGGIFRLITMDSNTGGIGMIEDHLPADLPVVADHGVVFYTRQAWTGESMRWEAWASSADGLRKHMLYSTTEAVYLAMEDAADGRRLLLHRQYLEVKDGTPEIHCELRELSLDPLTDPDIKGSVAQDKLDSGDDERSTLPADSTELFTPPKASNSKQMPPGGTPPPITVPK